jgi:hypothetical protein
MTLVNKLVKDPVNGRNPISADVSVTTPPENAQTIIRMQIVKIFQV